MSNHSTDTARRAKTICISRFQMRTKKCAIYNLYKQFSRYLQCLYYPNDSISIYAYRWNGAATNRTIRQSSSVKQSGAAGMERLSLSSLLALRASVVKEFVQTSAQPHKTRSAHFKAQHKDWQRCNLHTLSHISITMIQYAFQYLTLYASEEPCITVLYITRQRITLYYITIHCSKVHYNTVQYVAFQYTALQYITLHYNHVFTFTLTFTLALTLTCALEIKINNV